MTFFSGSHTVGVGEPSDLLAVQFELIKINDRKFHSLYTISNLEEFLRILDTERAREWDKANNCREIRISLNKFSNLPSSATKGFYIMQ